MALDHRCPWCGERTVSRSEAIRSMQYYRNRFPYKELAYECPRCARPIKMITNHRSMWIWAIPLVVLVLCLFVGYSWFWDWLADNHGVDRTVGYIVEIALLVLLMGSLAVLSLLTLYGGSFYRMKKPTERSREYVVSPVPLQLVIETDRRIPLRTEKILAMQFPLSPAQLYIGERKRELTAFFEPSARIPRHRKFAYDIGFVLAEHISLEHITVGMDCTVILNDGDTAVPATVAALR